jgi:hypothetical protein
MSFSDNDRVLLAAMADVLIPAAGKMPSASQAGVAGTWLDHVLSARSDLAAGLADVLGKARGGEPANMIAILRASDPAAFGVLAEIVPAAYFMNPDVRQAIGYSGQGPRTIDPHPDYLDDGLLESVASRGPIYRPTPKSN